MNGERPSDANPGGGVLSAAARTRGDRLAIVLLASLLLHLALIALPDPGRRLADATGNPLTAMLAAASEPQAARGSPTRPATARQERRITAPVASAPEATSGYSAAPAPGAQLLASAPYYPSEQLTIKPAALAEPELDPAELAHRVASGEIVLALWIDERGEVVEVDVERSELPSAFVHAATSAFGALHFTPGELDGRRVGSVLRVAVRYDDLRLTDALNGAGPNRDAIDQDRDDAG